MICKLIFQLLQILKSNYIQASFQCLLAEYDSKIDFDEFIMGISLIRKSLIKKAEGRVLEVTVSHL